MSRHLVFVYGTLKSGQPNHQVLNDTNNGISQFVLTAKTIDKWPLIIASKYNIPFLLHKCGSGEQICGEIYSVDDRMLQFLDEFECHPSYYTRIETPVKSDDDSQYFPWIYFLKNYKPQLLDRPFIQSYSSYGSHGLPYIESEQTRKVDDIEI